MAKVVDIHITPELQRAIDIANNMSASATVQKAVCRRHNIAEAIASSQNGVIDNAVDKANEVTYSPCLAVTHGMYSVNSAKIYI